MDCKKQHDEIQAIMAKLPPSQGGPGRHKCAACAYEEGYKDGLNGHKRDVALVLLSLPESQARNQRHKSCEVAYEWGYQAGDLQRKNGESASTTEGYEYDLFQYLIVEKKESPQQSVQLIKRIKDHKESTLEEEYKKSDFHKRIQNSILSEIRRVKNNKILSKTEKDSIVKSRLGQGIFRSSLISYWGGCAISDSKQKAVLIASHIKPWKVSNNTERLDVYNGLLLQANYDRLFDNGYISFDMSGKILYSSLLPVSERKILHLTDDVCLRKIEEAHQKYFKYHREYCFMP